ncbi:VCP-like ATPase, partial [Linum grandiflorum]
EAGSCTPVCSASKDLATPPISTISPPSRSYITAEPGKELSVSMAILGRLLTTARFLCSNASSKSFFSPRHGLTSPHRYHHPFSGRCSLLRIPDPVLVSDATKLSSLYPILLLGLLSGGLNVACAEPDQDVAAALPPLPSQDTPSSYADLEEAAKKERKRIEDVLISKGVKHGSYPRFTVAVKGQKITVKFQISPSCDISVLIAHLVSHLGLKSNDSSGGSDMLVRSWDSAVSWQLILSHPVIKETSVTKSHKGDVNKLGGELCIVLFRSLVKTDKAEIEFLKHGTFSAVELDALVSVLQLAGGKLKIVGRKPVESAAARAPTIDQSVTSLKAMGVRIYGLKTPLINSTSNEISWENIAGYDKQKREIEDTILLALHNPEIYDNIARGTRDKFESNRPRAVLFEGPPGTGKTSCARVIANQAGVPLLYVPLEVVVSKYYGESERQLGKVFSLANELPNGAIIFLDEVDSFAVTRDGEMHEATRRILSVLLRQVNIFCLIFCHCCRWPFLLSCHFLLLLVTD